MANNKKTVNGNRRRMIISGIVMVVLAVIIGISMVWSRQIELALTLAQKGYYDDNGEFIVVEQSAASIGELTVHYVDVGQGDCTIVELPDGKTMIIDGGDTKTAVKTALLEYIPKNLGDDFTYFDYCILTHSDSDHCGSLDDVLNAYPAQVSYRPNVEATRAGFTDPGKDDLTADAADKNTVAYKNAIAAMYAVNEQFTPIVYVTDPGNDAQTITGGNGDSAYSFTFYTPLSDVYGDWNNYSPICILEYRGFKFAFSGDAEAENEAEFAQKVQSAKTDGVTDKYDVFTDDYCVNVVKAGHHGSRTSTSKAFLDIMTTESGAPSVYYVISCGANNSYGHPHEETLTRLDGMGVPSEHILRTDTAGDIVISIRPSDNGEFALFYGDTAQDPAEPTDPVDPVDPVAPTGEIVLLYRELWGIKLTWPVTAWSAYAALCVLVLLFDVCESIKPSARRKRK